MIFRSVVTRQAHRIRKMPQWLRLFALRLLPGEHFSPTMLSMSMDLTDDTQLARLLGGRPAFHSRLIQPGSAQFIGWGRRWSGRRAVELAARHSCGFMLLEDGFLRSFERNAPSRAIVMDDIGIYYDAATPSRLEALIAAPKTPDELARADRIMAEWRRLAVSKYNAMPDYAGELPEKYVLVVDQVAGDMAIACGLAGPESFTRMLDAALREHPQAMIVLKVHPDLAMRNRHGHLDLAALAQNPRILILAAPCHPARLIARADAVYTVTSQIGFEALIWGRPVRCFGMPFYAGWGLTADDLAAPVRRVQAGLGALVHAALVDYCRYIAVDGQNASTVEQVMGEIGAQRAIVAHDSAQIYALGFSRWKRAHLAAFLPASRLHFVADFDTVPAGADMAIWGNCALPAGREFGKVLRVEDGFLRSTGLGAELVAPLSWVVDETGIYYDSARPSALENRLNAGPFDADMMARAARLRHAICAASLSKYNLGGGNWQRPSGVAQVILVPGQVEGDAAIRFGGGAISTNAALLRAVRAANPTAYILYKPHPDVVAGLRRAGAGNLAALCDAVVVNVDPLALLKQVDAVHVMTSLLGFEALLRGVAVQCYGQPFYAGWGLTVDHAPLPRRHATRNIDELVAAALIDYPRYLGAANRMLCDVEQVVADLTAQRQTGPKRANPWRRVRRRALGLWARYGPRRNA